MRLLDGELADHAGLAVAVDRAEERVAAGLLRDAEARRAAVLDDGALAVDAVALDRDVVRRALRVLGLDRDLAGLGLGGGELVGGAAARGDRDAQRAVLLLRGALRLLGAGLGQGPGVLARLAGRLGDILADVGHRGARDEVGGHQDQRLVGLRIHLHAAGRVLDLVVDDARGRALAETRAPRAPGSPLPGSPRGAGRGPAGPGVGSAPPGGGKGLCPR